MIHQLIARLFSIFLILIFVVQVKAQEVFFPLGANPVIKEFLKANPRPSNVAYRILAADTVPLPFKDDFSGRGIYPDANFWNDSDAFINTTFCKHPPTIGVATLDGIDQYGNPYNELSGASDTADFLTSHPIGLSPADTGVWFTFFYQPQGLGDEPEIPDSLTLQFLNLNGDWSYIWSRAGRSDSAFKRVDIHITDSVFLYNGFRFRFVNYATLNGNRDHWNIDYVWLDNGRFANDSLQEIALVYPVKTYLNDFMSMPYTHYKHLTAAGINPVKTFVADTVRFYNFSTLSTTNASMKFLLNDLNGPFNYSQNFSPISFTPTIFSKKTYDLAVPDTVFPSFPAVKYADFLVRHTVSSLNPGIESNDTSYFNQRFQNYYAQDDGSAEVAYGVNQAGAKIAYRFSTKMTDTLRGVQIYFNPVGDIVHDKLFQLCYWSSVDPSTNTENLVYKMINQKPANIDSINGFATYLFDTILVVPAGTMYLGWLQNDATMLGVGVDRNTSASGKMFFTLSGFWTLSGTEGAWMIRPLFGDTVVFSEPIGITEHVASSFSFVVYPNPASSEVSLAIHPEKKTMYEYQLFNNLGELVSSGLNSSGRIAIDHLPNGFYFVRLTDARTKESVTRKLIVQHD